MLYWYYNIEIICKIHYWLSYEKIPLIGQWSTGRPLSSKYFTQQCLTPAIPASQALPPCSAHFSKCSECGGNLLIQPPLCRAFQIIAAGGKYAAMSFCSTESPGGVLGRLACAALKPCNGWWTEERPGTFPPNLALTFINVTQCNTWNSSKCQLKSCINNVTHLKFNKQQINLTTMHNYIWWIIITHDTHALYTGLK